jgi:hypothetical protein
MSVGYQFEVEKKVRGGLGFSPRCPPTLAWSGKVGREVWRRV